MQDLPNKFVKNNGDSLLFNHVALSLPDGAKWNFQLMKLDGKFCFLRGWPEFVKFYSIQPGYFLVFQLKGICCFNVLIFDTSATEIDYPMRRPPVLIPKSESEDEEESIHILHEAALKKRKRMEKKEKETSAYCSLRKMKKNMEIKIMKHREFTTPQVFSDEDEDEDEDEDLETNYSPRQTNYRGSAYNESEDGRSSPESMRPMNPRKAPQVLTENQLVVLRRASSFKCRTKNPSFMVTMRPSYIQTGNCLLAKDLFGEIYKGIDGREAGGGRWADLESVVRGAVGVYTAANGVERRLEEIRR
ncbi:B3 domain-containing transcription factor VRN1-like [Cucumis melo var. makuwa]|uniref:B3 domain-containing transcription factor VRN1-like n=1 Tax=Cucumis melo var. makuwa TaxID=1194695 RepID=A0A5A7TVE2_CUCMM|nr:B3 domain-containing transcription factor VRN1-like [Cucumis melo var. makuwa]TYK13740.1 B3 domain-containing transcription factor VRN1-like [Cucumis melo var. makuwa]